MSRSAALGVILTALMGAGVIELSRRPAPARPAQPLAIDHPLRRAGIPPVRVLLFAGPARSVRLRVDGPYQVRGVDDWRVLAQGERLQSHTVRVSPAGFRIGPHDVAGSRLEVVAVKPASLRVGTNRYRGSLRLLRRSNGTIAVVNVVDIEDYIASVINSELPSHFPAAARRSQAIAARTYVLYRMKTAHPNSDYDVFDNTRSQMYRGVEYDQNGRSLAAETPESRKLADETRGIVATYRGRIFSAYYSAICGGRTTRGIDIFEDAVGPLSSVPCDWCRGSKYYRWQCDLSDERIRKGLEKQHGALGSVTRLEVQGTGADGRVPRVRVTGSRRTVTLSAYKFRLAVSPGDLKSGFFQADRQGGGYHFRGRGWGHGVGLCQWGARGQAMQGRNCVEILHHYYPGSRLVAVR